MVFLDVFGRLAVGIGIIGDRQITRDAARCEISRSEISDLRSQIKVGVASNDSMQIASND